MREPTMAGVTESCLGPGYLMAQTSAKGAFGSARYTPRPLARSLCRGPAPIDSWMIHGPKATSDPELDGAPIRATSLPVASSMQTWLAAPPYFLPSRRWPPG